MTERYLFENTDEQPWMCAASKGVSYKSLRFDPETRGGAVMIHMTPGTTYPRHRAHAGVEVLVLDGDLVVQGNRVNRGAYAHIPAAAVLAPHTESGCVLFVTFSGRVENLHA
ncbi:MAG: cupin domain-containing protein [Myxococcota bacterium]